MKHLEDWTKSRVKPPEGLKLQTADKEFNAGYKQGYSEAYQGILAAFDEYIARYHLAQRFNK